MNEWNNRSVSLSLKLINKNLKNDNPKTLPPVFNLIGVVWWNPGKRNPASRGKLSHSPVCSGRQIMQDLRKQQGRSPNAAWLGVIHTSFIYSCEEKVFYIIKI